MGTFAANIILREEVQEEADSEASMAVDSSNNERQVFFLAS